MFCLIKYHQNNVIQVMSSKLFKEVTEKYIKEDGCIASHGLLQVSISLDCLSA
jgi:hypothetical protein